jgi:hypothetical protein
MKKKESVLSNQEKLRVMQMVSLFNGHLDKRKSKEYSGYRMEK